MSFYYLATPYSQFHAGLEEAFRMACRQAAVLTKARVPVFSPIAHSHAVALHGFIDPRDLKVWLPANKPFMDVALGCIVPLAPGWAESAGVTAELAIFRAAGKPVYMMEPGIVPAELRS